LSVGAALRSTLNKIGQRGETERDMADEATIYEGSSSQVVNVPVFLLCGLIAGGLLGGAMLVGNHSGPLAPTILVAAAALPLLFALYRMLQIKCRQYVLTTERVRIRQGILSKRTDEVELYRVRDYVLIEPLVLRLLGLSDLVLTTDDTTNPRVVLRAIHGGQALKDQVRQHVEICRDKKRVRVTEFQDGEP